MLEDDGRRFTILEMERNRIAKVRIERLKWRRDTGRDAGAIRADLISHSEPWKLPVMQRFFKEPIDAYCTYTEHVRTSPNSMARCLLPGRKKSGRC